jgi:crotonobetainyl-CoA:carnitine CoA-transferase CaiB-like acyl-CoA transferase
MTDKPYAKLLDSLDLQSDVSVSINGHDPVLPTRFRLAESAAAVLAAIGTVAAEIWKMRGGEDQTVGIDLPHVAAALNSYRYHRIIDGLDPMTQFASGPRQVTTGIYPTKDGRFFHTHGSFDPTGMCAAIGVKDPTPQSMSEAVANWAADDLEHHLADLGHCGAIVRSRGEWAEHPHGQALADKPVVEILPIGESAAEPFSAATRPLSGIRALDLTRVLAGPTCARTLAEHGADVLRISAEHLPTHAFFDLDTSHGKRWANLNLKETGDLATLRELVRAADVFSEGYRPGVMQRFGLSAEELHSIRPGIIYVTINCYGHSGPFASRPGWEQLGQSVSGMAFEEGGRQAPRLVPAAACDYTTGYLAALGTLVALKRRAEHGGSYQVRVSLARTGMWYLDQPRVAADVELPKEVLSREQVTPYMTTSQIEEGSMVHLAPAVKMSKTTPHWTLASPSPGSSSPTW